jgi:hypothetical protein
MSEKKVLLTEQEVKRFAKLSGVKITPELLNEKWQNKRLLELDFSDFQSKYALDTGFARHFPQPVAAQPKAAQPVAAPKTGPPPAAPSQAGPLPGSQADIDYRDAMGHLDKVKKMINDPNYYAKAKEQPAGPTADVEAWNQGEAARQAGGIASPEQDLARQTAPARAVRRGNRRRSRRGGSAKTHQALNDAGIRSYDDFYAGLKATGLTGLLGTGRAGGKDKRWGPKHQAALAAWQDKTGFDPTGSRARARSGAPVEDQNTGGSGAGDLGSNLSLRTTPFNFDSSVPSLNMNTNPRAPRWKASTDDFGYDHRRAAGMNPEQEARYNTSRRATRLEEELIQTLTERILIKYFKK